MKYQKLISGFLTAAMVAGMTITSMPVLAAEPSFAGLEDYKAPVKSDVFEAISEHTHGSGNVEFSDGEELVVWFQGNGERKANDGRIMAARRLPGGDWQEPFVIADTPGMPDVNPTVYVDENDRLWLFWYPVLANQWQSSQPKFKYADKGHYESANGYTAAPDWDWQEIMYPVPGDDFVGQAIAMNDGIPTYRVKGDQIKHLNASQFEQWESKDDPTAYVKVDDNHYVTDSFVTSLYNGYMEAADFVATDPMYANHPLKQDLIDLLSTYAGLTASIASGETNNAKQWNPSYRRIGWQTKNKPMEIQMEDGHTRMLLPLYADQFAASIMAYSDDNGKTWEYSDAIAAMGDIQAATVQKADGTLRSYFRNAEPSGYLVYHDSTDGGETWSGVGVEDQLSHVGGFDVTKLPDGRWVMAITECITDATENQDNRSRLNIAVSEDEGETWVKTPLEEDMAGIEGYHYAAITVDDDDVIHVSYSYDSADRNNTIRVATFEPKKTSGGSSSGGGSVAEYPVVVSSVENGTVTASPKQASKGDSVTITVKPDAGYVLDKLTITDAKGKALTAQDKGDGKYTFQMPASKVTVKASFVENNTGLPFTDVKSGDWFLDSVKYVYEMGMMKGVSDDVFAPNATTTRGMIVTILHSLEGFPEAADAGFADVAADAWYANAVNWAAAQNIVSGYGKDSFGPNDNITREQMAAILYRYAQYKGMDVSLDEASDVLADFHDADAISEYAVTAMQWACSNGLLSGMGDGTLVPNGEATRAQVAAILRSFCESAK